MWRREVCLLRGFFCLVSSGWRLRPYVPTKRWYLSARLHGVTSEKTVIFRMTVVFWVVTLCILVSAFQNIYLFHPQGLVDIVVTTLGSYTRSGQWEFWLIFSILLSPLCKFPGYYLD
jgi:hypothetical protein